MEQFCKVMDKDGNFLDTLPLAKTAYSLKSAPLHTAKLTLPVKDGGNALCAPLNRVELFDNGNRVELFRVIGMPSSKIKRGGTITHNLEHVLAYLCDDVMPDYREIGGTGVTLRQCAEYILGFQTVRRWQLGRCDFSTQFQYAFTDESLLRALLSLPKQLVEDYQWASDTTTTPWTLHLTRATTTVECEARYERNMLEIDKSYDATGLCTKVWAYGYGEGVNRLNISGINGGRRYLEADTISKYGVIQKTFTDKTIEQAAALKNRTQQWLNEHKNPRYTYKIKAIDIYAVTGEPFDRFYPGKLCRINDQEHGEMLDARVLQIDKPNPESKPADITITLANRAAGVAGEMADLAARTRINELYAQGTTCVFQADKAASISKDKPLKFKINLPRELVSINKMRLTYELDRFRGYVTGAEAGGSSHQTSSEGGGSVQSSSAGGGGSTTSAAGGGDTLVKSRFTASPNLSCGGAVHPTTEQVIEYTSNTTPTTGNLRHNHFMPGHKHVLHGQVEIPEFTIPGKAHTHTTTLSNHQHTTALPAHTHAYATPAHTHAPIYGIHEGPNVAAVQIKVDGNAVASADFASDGVNLIPYLRKDASGEVVRGSTHLIEVYAVPTASNPEGLAYVDASVFVMTFVRSYGGGNY